MRKSAKVMKRAELLLPRVKRLLVRHGFPGFLPMEMKRRVDGVAVEHLLLFLKEQVNAVRREVGLPEVSIYRQLLDLSEAVAFLEGQVALLEKTATGREVEPETDQGPMAVCRECGQILPVSEMLPYGAAHVCARCKEDFLQRLREGVGKE